MQGNELRINVQAPHESTPRHDATAAMPHADVSVPVMQSDAGNDDAKSAKPIVNEQTSMSPVRQPQPKKNKEVLPPLEANPDFRGIEFVSVEEGKKNLPVHILHKSFRLFADGAVETCKNLIDAWIEGDRKAIQSQSHKAKGSWS